MYRLYSTRNHTDVNHRRQPTDDHTQMLSIRNELRSSVSGRYQPRATDNADNPLDYLNPGSISIIY
jgi:hypothetical protein